MEKKLTAQFFVKNECIDQFKELTKDLIENTRKEAGNVSYKLYQQVEDAGEFIFVEAFKDEAAFNMHIETNHFKAFSSAIADMQKQAAILTPFS